MQMQTIEEPNEKKKKKEECLMLNTSFPYYGTRRSKRQRTHHCFVGSHLYSSFNGIQATVEMHLLMGAIIIIMISLY